MMNDGNPIKPKLKTWLYRTQRKRYARFLLHDGKQLIKRNPALGKEALSREEIQAVREQWGGLRMPVSPLWHQIYKNLLGEFNPKMIPMTIFYLRFEAFLTDKRVTQAYADKNAHHIFIPDSNRPEMILQQIHHRYYQKDWKPISESEIEKYLRQQEGAFFLKPSMDGNGGKYLRPFQVHAGVVTLQGNPCTVKDLLAPYPQNFLIQRKVVQSAEIAAIYPHSVNTFRVTTIREGHEIRCLNNVMRIGRGGSEIDNTCKGGMVVGIYDNGSISPRAIDGSFRWLDRHPDTGVCFAELQPLACAKKVEEEAVRLHANISYADMICWDLTFDERGQVVVIEYNLKGFGVIMQQVFHGPFLGEQTEWWTNKMREVWKDADCTKGYYPSLPKL